MTHHTERTDGQVSITSDQLAPLALRMFVVIKAALRIVDIWGPCNSVMPESEAEQQALTAMQFEFEDIVAAAEKLLAGAAQ